MFSMSPDKRMNAYSEALASCIREERWDDAERLQQQMIAAGVPQGTVRDTARRLSMAAREVQVVIEKVTATIEAVSTSPARAAEGTATVAIQPEAPLLSQWQRLRGAAGYGAKAGTNIKFPLPMRYFRVESDRTSYSQQITRAGDGDASEDTASESD